MAFANRLHRCQQIPFFFVGYYVQRRGTQSRKDFAEANDIIANLPIERETGVEISRTHVIFDYYLFYRNNIFLRLYSTISFLDTVVQLARMKDG